jgi:hypothetical protein
MPIFLVFLQDATAKVSEHGLDGVMTAFVAIGVVLGKMLEPVIAPKKPSIGDEKIIGAINEHSTKLITVLNELNTKIVHMDEKNDWKREETARKVLDGVKETVKDAVDDAFKGAVLQSVVNAHIKDNK